MNPKIVIETVDEHVRIFHTNFELTTGEVQDLARNHMPDGDELVSALAHEIVQLPGVERVILRPYGIGVHKGAAFDWDELDATIQEILRWVGTSFGAVSAHRPGRCGTDSVGVP